MKTGLQRPRHCFTVVHAPISSCFTVTHLRCREVGNRSYGVRLGRRVDQDRIDVVLADLDGKLPRAALGELRGDETHDHATSHHRHGEADETEPDEISHASLLVSNLRGALIDLLMKIRGVAPRTRPFSHYAVRKLG